MPGISRGNSCIAVTAAVLVLGGVSVQAAAASPPAVPPTLSFLEHSVVASGVTPGGQVVWFGLMRELNQGALDWSHVETIVPGTSGAGVAQLDIGKPVPLQSIWFAVDLTTGQFAAGAPPGYALRRFSLAGGAFPTTSTRVEIGRRLVVVLCVRPGVGAWTLRVGDGGPGDVDGVADGTVRIDVGQLVAVGAPSSLQSLASRDVVIVVDQERMDFTAFTLN
jgi:hypothetical protein